MRAPQGDGESHADLARRLLTAPTVRPASLARIALVTAVLAAAPLGAEPTRLATAAPAMAPPSRPLLERAPRLGPPGPMRFERAVRGPRTAPTTYDGLIRTTAARHGVEYALVKAVIQAESDFDRLAVSPKGAGGLMQLMPATAASHGVGNVFFPAANIDGGCRYLRFLLDRYDGSLTLALAAYNAGPARVDAAGGVPAIAETREYLDRVLRFRLGYLRER